MRLIDCFTGLMAYAAHSMAVAEESPLAFDQFKKDIDQLLEQSEKLFRKNGFSEEDYDHAKFAVCAYVDETILCSAWKERERWESQQLQRLYYRTTNAGEEFFERLYSFSAEQREVLEVYCTCLVMGFKGRYFAVRDIIQLEATGLEVIEKVMEQVSNPFSSEEMKFFPGSYLEESEKSRRKRQWGLVPFFLVLLIIGVGVAASVFFLMDNYLNEIVDLYFQSGGK